MFSVQDDGVASQRLEVLAGVRVGQTTFEDLTFGVGKQAFLGAELENHLKPYNTFLFFVIFVPAHFAAHFHPTE